MGGVSAAGHKVLGQDHSFNQKPFAMWPISRFYGTMNLFQIFISWEPMLSPSIFAVPYAISPTDTNPQAAQLTGYSSGVMKPKPLSEKNFFKVPNLQ